MDRGSVKEHEVIERVRNVAAHRDVQT